MNARWYILDEHGEPVAAASNEAGAKWLEQAGMNRIVASTDLAGCRVSTVFLGLNHGWEPGEPPLLFETLVIGGPLDGEMERTSTRVEAEQAHGAMVSRVRAAGDRARARPLAPFRRGLSR